MTSVTRRELLSLPGALAFSGGRSAQERLRVVVVGAHPDDPETGCGGTSARLSTLGHDVVFAYLTRGEAGIPGEEPAAAARIRTAEATAAAKILGVRAVFLGQIDGATEINGRRYDEAREILMAQEPDLVLAHWPIDTHRDHRAASMLAYDTWLTAGRRFALYYFEVMTGAQTQTFSPTDYVDVSSTLEQKHRACFTHRSQHIERDYAQYHGAMEAFRGLECGCASAEAFRRHSTSPVVTLP